MDVKNEFLNGDLQEEVYMIPPPSVSHNHGQVCKLKKKGSLWSLKEAPRTWFVKFSIVIASLGFHYNDYDSTLFLKNSLHVLLFSLYILMTLLS